MSIYDVTTQEELDSALSEHGDDIEVTPNITITEDAEGNPWAAVYGLYIAADIMDKLVSAWLLKTIPKEQK